MGASRIERNTENRARGGLERDGSECAFINGAAGIQGRLDCDKHPRSGDCQRVVDDAGHLNVAASEVCRDLVAGDGEFQTRQDGIESPVVIELEVILVVVVAVWKLGDAGAETPLGAVY